MAARIRHPKNVDGDFYVEDGCCTLCGTPQSVAPEFFAWAGDEPAADHCYIARQPEGATEVARMVDAMATQDLGCIRYCGRDPSVQERLFAAGESRQCDHLPPTLRLRAWLRGLFAA